MEIYPSVKPRKLKKTNKPSPSSAGFSLGGLMDGIQKLVETAAALQKSGPVSQTGEFSIPGLGEKGKGIFGFSIRTMADAGSGGVKVQPFGNIHKSEKGGVSVEEAREAVARAKRILAAVQKSSEGAFSGTV